MTEKFQTSMSSKGQVVIAKEIRRMLRLKANQKFVEEVRGKEIVLKPVPTPAELKGALQHVAGGKSVDELSRWIDKGWE